MIRISDRPAGASLGFAFYKLVGCSTGARPLTSNPVISVIYASGIGSLVTGCSNKEIARKLGIGEESVKSHLKSLFHKLGVADRTQAAIEAIRHGIVHLDG